MAWKMQTLQVGSEGYQWDGGDTPELILEGEAVGTKREGISGEGASLSRGLGSGGEQACLGEIRRLAWLGRRLWWGLV